MEASAAANNGENLKPSLLLVDDDRPFLHPRNCPVLRGNPNRYAVQCAAYSEHFIMFGKICARLAGTIQQALNFFRQRQLGERCTAHGLNWTFFALFWLTDYNRPHLFDVNLVR